MSIVQVAVPSPLQGHFDYLAPAGSVFPGCRVRVPFGRTARVGVVLAVGTDSPIGEERLKPVLEVLDDEAVLPQEIMALLTWASHYYHHPVGEVCAAALPVRLRQGGPAVMPVQRQYRLTEEGSRIAVDSLHRAPRQAELLARLQQMDGVVTKETPDLPRGWQSLVGKLVAKGWVAVHERVALPLAGRGGDRPLPLTDDQQRAVTRVLAGLGTFQGFLLDGVTGSGKTEVYLQIIAENLAAGRQTLVLVPEIGLTPQLLERFRRRFAVPIAMLHSALAESERLQNWLAACSGEVPIVIGTRSAVFVPMPRLGLIIVDEEHDPSYKQQDGFRYSARDVAVVRARQAGVPVVLGSATASLESMANARAGRYLQLSLPQRAGGAGAPALELLDVRHLRLEGGMSAPLFARIDRHLQQGGQVLLFLNRRGYAPALLCHDCGWVAHCRRCDAHLTYHAAQRRLRCHHCGSEQPLPSRCGECAGTELHPVGQGTERVEDVLRARYPGVDVERIDRDATRRRGSLEDKLERVHSGSARLLVGTQMLAKGHHFPHVTLAGILNADQGLFSADFRASERMAQMILQVAGRAGRADRPGEVIIQTHHADHPLLQQLVGQGYHACAADILDERRVTGLPPYSHLALLRAEAVSANVALDFLEAARELALAEGLSGVQLLGPVPAPMERRAGRYRAQLLLQADRRQALHVLLEQWLPGVGKLRLARKVRWSLDVDPLEMF